jgi:hypothetical protein
MVRETDADRAFRLLVERRDVAANATQTPAFSSGLKRAPMMSEAAGTVAPTAAPQMPPVANIDLYYLG